MEPKVKLAKSPRTGRGFSLGELKKAGMDIRAARKKGIRVDKFRKSTHDENVKILKGGGKEKKAKKPVKASKKKAVKTKKAPPPPPKKE
jgi:large subunit ribosomal protein L13e